MISNVKALKHLESSRKWTSVLICVSFISHLPSLFCTRLSFVCTRLSFVCTRLSFVFTRLSLVFTLLHSSLIRLHSSLIHLHSSLIRLHSSLTRLHSSSLVSHSSSLVFTRLHSSLIRLHSSRHPSVILVITIFIHNTKNFLIILLTFDLVSFFPFVLNAPLQGHKSFLFYKRKKCIRQK